ncbi:hypothetical protein BH23GEM7_BH23GEM7_02030 [soil metagenome]
MASPVLPPDALSEIPQRLPILPLEGLVVFPRVLLPLAVSIPEHVALLDEVLQSHKMIALAVPRPGREHTEGDPDDPPFFEVGTLAQIVRMMKLPDDSMRILVQGMSRLRFESFMKRGDWWFANVQPMEDVEEQGPELEALRRAVTQLFQQIIALSPDLPDEITQVLATLTEGARLADFIAGNAAFDTEAKQALLAEPDVRARLERLSELLGQELQILEYRSQIQNRVKTNVERTQREYWLREQMREIQKELGEGESGEVERLREEVAGADLSDPERTLAISGENLPRYAGPPRFRSEIAGREDEIGMATGLAWTPVGGEVLFLEAVRMPGKGKISLTGQLGEVMKESAQAAYSFLRSHTTDLDIDPELFSTSDLHLHVPAGAIPKDGPSAGVAMATALASLLTGRPVRRDVAMTGEITLRGHVLPVGGIKEKVIAGQRAGIRKVLLPERNRPDAEEIPAEVRESIEIEFIEHVDEAFRRALAPGDPGEARSYRELAEERPAARIHALKEAQR